MTIVHVAVAVLRNSSGQVLISKRHADVHQGGLWEFPGGKLETGESTEQALQREILEELGIYIERSRPLIRVHHNYGDKAVLLDVYEVLTFTGDETGREGQQIKWVDVDQLVSYDFPAADVPILNAIRLPDHYLITPHPSDDVQRFLDHLMLRLQQGISLVQLRAKGWQDDALVALGNRVSELCNQYNARLMVNSNVQVVSQIDGAGLHLDSWQLAACTQRPIDLDRILSASCHNEQELAHAASIGSDFLVLSPVAATQSHPDAVPLGWKSFQSLIENVPVPVYALGGMNWDDREAAWQHGAQGIAAISALWKAS